MIAFSKDAHQRTEISRQSSVSDMTIRDMARPAAHGCRPIIVLSAVMAMATLLIAGDVQVDTAEHPAASAQPTDGNIASCVVRSKGEVSYTECSGMPRQQLVHHIDDPVGAEPAPLHELNIPVV